MDSIHNRVRSLFGSQQGGLGDDFHDDIENQSENQSERLSQVFNSPSHAGTGTGNRIVDMHNQRSAERRHQQWEQQQRQQQEQQRGLQQGEAQQNGYLFGSQNQGQENQGQAGADQSPSIFGSQTQSPGNDFTNQFTPRNSGRDGKRDGNQNQSTPQSPRHGEDIINGDERNQSNHSPLFKPVKVTTLLDRFSGLRKHYLDWKRLQVYWINFWIARGQFIRLLFHYVLAQLPGTTRLSCLNREEEIEKNNTGETTDVFLLRNLFKYLDWLFQPRTQEQDYRYYNKLIGLKQKQDENAQQFIERVTDIAAKCVSRGQLEDQNSPIVGRVVYNGLTLSKQQRQLLSLALAGDYTKAKVEDQVANSAFLQDDMDSQQGSDSEQENNTPTSSTMPANTLFNNIRNVVRQEMQKGQGKGNGNKRKNKSNKGKGKKKNNKTNTGGFVDYRSKKLCFRCGSPGHFVKDCPMDDNRSYLTGNVNEPTVTFK